MSPAPNNVTVLRATAGRDLPGHATCLRPVLAKRLAHGPAGYRVTNFSAGRWYQVHERSVGCFADLAALLPRVARDPTACIIRGAPLPGIDRGYCRRLCDRAEHGDDVTFAATERQWLALDIDGVHEPPCCTFAAEPEDGVEHVLGLLPEPFNDASCWWQATGSAGIKPGIRCRVWSWLSRPVSDGEAKGWLTGYPVDLGLFAPVQPHYTAPPILAPGVRYPVVRRCGIRRGLVDTVEVPDVLPAAKTLAAAPVMLAGAELSVEDLAALRAAVLRSPRVREIWVGIRTYPDRSSGHFALATALIRAGCRDPDLLHRVLLAYDQRRGHDTAKILHADYARRTIARALAAARAS